MAFVSEYVRQEDWEFFNALDIQFERKHITANQYSNWVIDREREIIFTMVGRLGRDHGRTFILIWGKSRVYIYVEGRSVRPSDNGVRTYHWDIQSIKAPARLKDKKKELVSLIREVSEIKNEGEIGGVFVLDNIAEPQFVEGE